MYESFYKFRIKPFLEVCVAEWTPIIPRHDTTLSIRPIVQGNPGTPYQNWALQRQLAPTFYALEGGTDCIKPVHS